MVVGQLGLLKFDPKLSTSSDPRETEDDGAGATETRDVTEAAGEDHHNHESCNNVHNCE